MRRKIGLFLSMLLFISYVSGQEESDPLRYDATDAKRISYGDSTWITRKDNAPAGELVYSATSLGKPFTGFRVMCGWLRNQDIRNHFAFYYKESSQDDWVELIGFSWDVRTYPSPWYQVSYAYGEFPQGKAVSDFKIRLKETSYNKDDWDLGYNTLVGRVVLFTDESRELGIDEEKQYAVTNADGRYWAEQDGYIVLTETVPTYNGTGAWQFVKNDDLTYTVKYANNSVVLSFDAQLAFNDDQKNGVLLRYGNQHKYSHTEEDVQIGSDDSFLISKTESGKYTLRRSHDGRVIGRVMTDPALDDRISVTQGEAEEYLFTEISNPNGIAGTSSGLVHIASFGKNLDISGLNGSSLIQIYYISGVQIVQVQTDESGFTCTLESGLYIVSVLTKEKVIRKKIIIK